MKKLHLSALLMLMLSLVGCGGTSAVVLASKPKPRLTIVPVPSLVATSNVPFNYTVKASGGVGAYRWSLLSPLPNGLSFKNGVISGTPVSVSKSTTWTVTVQVQSPQ